MRSTVYILATMIVCVLLAGCRSTQTVERVHTEYVRTLDTLETHDTVIKEVTTIVKEVDSMRLAEYGIRLEGVQKAWLVEKSQQEKQISQSRSVSSDTIIVTDTVPKIVEIEKQLTTIERIKIGTWWHLLVTTLLTMTLLIYTNRHRLWK